MHLDNGNLHSDDSVADSVAVVGVRTRVDDYAALVSAGGVYAVDYLALVVALEDLAAVEAKLLRFFCNVIEYVGIAVRAVDAGFSFSEKIKVGSVDDKYVFHSVNPFRIYFQYLKFMQLAAEKSNKLLFSRNLQFLIF